MGPKKNSRAQGKSGTNEHRKTPMTTQSTEKYTDFLLELQQLILDIFKKATASASSTDLKSLIQEVKGHLYDRNFATAFGKQEYLEAYVLRWSASRALGYTQILFDLDFWPPQTKSDSANAIHVHSSASRVVCIGGGAGAELVALAAAGRSLSAVKMEVFLIDIADWAKNVTDLQNALTTPPPLSIHASQAIQSTNRAMIDPSSLEVKFLKMDVLTGSGELQSILAGACLCTIMFTLNELFTSSIGQTTAFLLALTDAMLPGSSLLVVDSPGTYSEIQLGSSDKPKRYPMNWLLDHTLLEGTRDHKENSKWHKQISEESKWFRLDPSLEYPIDLENMRYQMHLYRRLPEV